MTLEYVSCVWPIETFSGGRCVVTSCHWCSGEDRYWSFGPADDLCPPSDLIFFFCGHMAKARVKIRFWFVLLFFCELFCFFYARLPGSAVLSF